MTQFRLRPVILLTIFGLLLSLPFVFNPGFDSVEELLWIALARHQNPFTLVSWNPLAPGFYRPLSYLAVFIPFRLFAGSPELIHACSAVMNLLNAFLLFRLLKTFPSLPEKTSALAALLFLLAPAVQPSVSYPLVVHDQLCASFLFAFFLCLRAERKFQNAEVIRALFFLLLALGATSSKESWLLLLPLLLLYGYFVGRPARWKTALALTTILALVYIPLRWTELLTPGQGAAFYHTSFGANIPRNLFEHFLFNFTPGLGIIYRMFQGTGGALYTLSLPISAALAFALLGIFLRTNRRMFFGFLLFYITALGPLLLLNGTSAHHAYLAAAGVAVMLAYLWSLSATNKITQGILLATLALYLAHAASLGVKKFEKASFQNKFLATFGEKLREQESWYEPVAVLLPSPDGADYMELNVVDFILRRKHDFDSLFSVNEKFKGEIYWHTFRWMDGRVPPPELKHVLLVDRAGNVTSGTSADLPPN